MADELSAVVGEVETLSLASNVHYVTSQERYDTLLTAYLKMKQKPNNAQVKKITSWLKARTQNDSIKVILY